MILSRIVALITFSSIAPAWISFSSCGSDTQKLQDDTHQIVQVVDSALPVFHGQNAYSHIQKQVNFGSRVPNSLAHGQCCDYLTDELKKVADSVFRQSFSQTIHGISWNLTNIIAQFQPNKKERVLLCAHWDCRPRSDGYSTYHPEQHPDYAKGIPGANDGASGVGVLLELARILSERKPDVGVDIVFFDGEDIGKGGEETYFIGSRFFVKNYPLAQQPLYVILLDMVGDKEAEFFKEANSYQTKEQKKLVDTLWQIGKHIAPNYFRTTERLGILDDHKPLIDFGFTAINIIDYEIVGNASSNPRRHYWHTQQDTMENISETTLSAVGTVLVHLLYKYPLLRL